MNGRALTAAFLTASSMMLGSAPAAEPPAATAPASTSTSTTTTTPAPIPFQHIAAQGDERLTRITDKMKLIPQGRALFDYAISKNIKFVWSDADEDIVGLYDFKTNLVTLTPDLTDDNAVSILIHELRHAWQSHEVDDGAWMHDPLTTWQSSQIKEVDACAFSAHAMAAYQEVTKAKPSYNIENFNSRIAQNYGALPADKRDFIRDAVAPCFKEIQNIAYYVDMHFNLVSKVFLLEQAYFHEASLKARMAISERRPFIPEETHLDGLSASEKARLFGGYLSTTLDKEDRPAPFKGMDAPAFLQWLDEQSLQNPKLSPTLKDMQAQFEEMKKSLRELQELSKLNAMTLPDMKPASGGFGSFKQKPLGPVPVSGP